MLPGCRSESQVCYKVWGSPVQIGVITPGIRFMTPMKTSGLNVDTTFGSSGTNYFNKANFYLDHKDGVIQGEWP